MNLIEKVLQNENINHLSFLKEGVEEDYLYHGTNEDVLDSILKDGLKPSRKGTLSLSKDEGYAKSYARTGLTPSGKTDAVMLRIKADEIHGETIPVSKSSPKSDQLNEILTKKVISPESIEIHKNGKWQPLTTIE